MNKNNAKALSTLRQKIRKYNRDFESHITNYKQVGMLEADFLNYGDSDPLSKTEEHLQMEGMPGEGIMRVSGVEREVGEDGVVVDRHH